MPALIATFGWRQDFWRSYLLLMLGISVDIDHLLAEPIYDPLRCSIGFHPLHTWPAVLLYCALCVPKGTRLLGIGLVTHMLLDAGDCLAMAGGASQLRNFLP